MDFYRRAGVVFAGFCLLMLVWNLATPANEDHWLNVVEHSTLATGFVVSVFVRFPLARWVQVGMLFLGAWMTAFAGDIPPAATVGTLATILAYAYGKFQPFPQFLMLGIAIMQLGVTFTSSVIHGQPTLVAAGRAIVWALLPLVGVWLFWNIMQQFAEKVLKQNRELLEINKTLVAGGKDAPY